LWDSQKTGRSTLKSTVLISEDMALPSGAPLPSLEEIAREREKNSQQSKKYTWSYSEDEVTIVVPLREGVTKSDIKVTLDGDQKLQVKVLGEEIINGTLFQEVEPEEMTYTITATQLTVELTMQTKMTW
jgi:HSP20 family molecular chaperone IbpA